MIAWYLDLQLHIQSVSITTNVVSSNAAHGEVCTIQYYIIQLVSDIRNVFGFLQVLRYPLQIKLTTTI
jgi:hypothetical protein